MKPNPLHTLYINGPHPQLLVEGQYISGALGKNGLCKFNVPYGTYTARVGMDEYSIDFTTDGQVIDPPKTTPPK